MLKINNTNSNLSISLKQIKTNKELKRQNDWIYIYQVNITNQKHEIYYKFH